MSSDYLPIVIPFGAIALSWLLLISTALFSYCCWGGSGKWIDVYEDNQRLGAIYKYVIRLTFGKTRNEFDITRTPITVDVFTENSKRMSSFVINPKLLLTAVTSKPGVMEIKFILHRKTPMSRIIRVVLNHKGKGSILVNHLEIQRVDWLKTHIAYVNEYIKYLNTSNAMIKQSYPSGTQENREVEMEALQTHLLTFGEYLAFIFMSFNLVPLFCLLLMLCTKKPEDSTDVKIEFCSDFGSGILSSSTSAIMSGTLTSLIFAILIFIYRFAVKTRVAKGSDFCTHFKISYIVVVYTIGVLSGLFAAIDAAKSARHSHKELIFERYWLLAFFLGILVFLLVWLPFISVMGLFIGFFSKQKIIPKYSDELPKSVTKSDKRQEKTQIVDKTSDKKTDSEESIGEGYYQQLMKRQKKVKSISQY